MANFGSNLGSKWSSRVSSVFWEGVLSWRHKEQPHKEKTPHNFSKTQNNFSKTATQFLKDATQFLEDATQFLKDATQFLTSASYGNDW